MNLIGHQPLSTLIIILLVINAIVLTWAIFEGIIHKSEKGSLRGKSYSSRS